MINSRTLSGVCPIDNRPGHVCGPDHMRLGPVDLTALEGPTVGERQELKEYSYLVGNTEVTAMLTDKLAERLNAKPVGEGAPDTDKGGHSMEQRQKQLGSTDMAKADADGVTPPADYSDASTKARKARNK